MAVLTASAKVLRKPKLLKMILLQLPVKDLLFTQAVCKKWKTVIENSPDLQKALFFQPATSQLAFFHDLLQDQPGSFPSLATADIFYSCNYDAGELKLVEKFEFARRYAWLLERVPGGRASIEADKEKLLNISVRTRVFLNPLLMSRFTWFREFFHATDNAPARFHRINLKNQTDLPEAARRKEASWRRMLITQPPLGAIPALMDGNKLAWNILGEDGWGKSVTMDHLRTKLALASNHKMKVRGTGLLEVWNDGEDLKKIAGYQEDMGGYADRGDDDVDAFDAETDGGLPPQLKQMGDTLVLY